MIILVLMVLIVAIILINKLGKSFSGVTGETGRVDDSQRRRIFYRTKDGMADYGFSFERQGDSSYRVYINSMPDYGSRNTSLSVTHRLTNSGRHYICWTQPLRTEEAVKQVTSLWADLTQEYIKTGRTIDEQMRNRR